MSRRSRDTLRNYFTADRRPTQDQFHDLIDSALNITDEGFSKTPHDGLRISSLGASSGLMSFYSPRSTGAEWAVGFASGQSQLVFRRPDADNAPLVTLDASTGLRVGINTDAPQDLLDVAGTVRSEGRRGREVGPLPADGDFHPLTDELHGCHAYEVIAGVGHRGAGRFALMHAVALNTFNPSWWDNLLFAKRRIRQQHAYYSRPSDRLQLRWATRNPEDRDTARGHGADATYQLQIGTRRDYQADKRVDGKLKGGASEIYFRAYVTELWFDDMVKDWVPTEEPK